MRVFIAFVPEEARSGDDADDDDDDDYYHYYYSYHYLYVVSCGDGRSRGHVSRWSGNEVEVEVVVGHARATKRHSTTCE